MTGGMRRRDVSALLLASMLGLGPSARARAAEAEASGLAFGDPFPLDYDRLVDRAAAAARHPYAPVTPPANDLIGRIDYATHGKIRFKPENALYANGPGVYPATFFHVGMYFRKGVRMHLLDDGMAARIIYDPRYFDMPADSIARELPPDVGFAGFRLQESRHRSDWTTQDWIAFLGASYFRAIGDLGQYGLSARGIVIDSATPRPEEFPDFTEFYIAPAMSEKEATTVLAMLEGPSVTGAYRFDIRRKEGVEVAVEARLFLRRDVERLGIAPLTSMFWYSEANRRDGDDWRPEIHDSDGLAIWTGAGERIWRPLANPHTAMTSSFLDETPRGFGLLQRDRSFEHYLDGVNYDLRPSLWIEPLDDWGRGAVQLVELPTDDEIHDNIGAFWVPEAPARAGASYRFRYRQYWQAEPSASVPDLARCVSTRIGRGGQPGQDHPPGVRKFVVAFDGKRLAALGKEDEVEVVVEASRGTLRDVFAEPVPRTPRWRMQFDLDAAGTEPVELRAFLRAGGAPLSETWLYRYEPGPGD